ncbi:MAG: YfbU family protein [Luteolibacter sp.]|uniref:YfbU family protein n=1 Tax=Luteolibacter sp. TaxID=1962973 RepID=UPI003267043A
MDLEISKKDRIILINQYRILAKLEPNESERLEELIEILENGYRLFYSMIDEWISDDMPEDRSILVLDILGIYRIIEDHKRLVSSQAVMEHSFHFFPGFDGNNESEYLSFSRFLIEKQGKFTEQKPYLKRNDNLNSHLPMVPKYRKMVNAWKSMGSAYHLTEQQILSILDA